jgi:hypothetical protein
MGIGRPLKEKNMGLDNIRPELDFEANKKQTKKPFKLPKDFWIRLRVSLALASCITFIYCGVNSWHEVNRCGVIVEKKDSAHEGSKGRVYTDEYFILKWDKTNKLKRIDPTSEDFYRFNIGDRACWDISERNETHDEGAKYFALIFFGSVMWLVGMGLYKGKGLL